MAKQRIINLPETTGEIQLRGYVTGILADNFYKQDVGRTGKPYRSMRFGVQVNEDSKVFLDLYESKPENVYFYKRSEIKGEKGNTKTVPYEQRNSFSVDGYNPIGMSNYIEIEVDEQGNQVKDEKGKLKNKNVTLNNYDSLEYLSKKLDDDKPVFVVGKTAFSSYMKGEERHRQTKLIPTRIMNSATIDFDDEDFKQKSDFKQTFIFTGITLDQSDKEDEKAIIEGLVVGYSTIENVELITRNKKLYKSLKTKVKPYTAMTVWGIINNRVEGEEVVVDDEWGEADTFIKPQRTFIFELEVTGVDPATFDTENYTQVLIDEALEAITNQERAKSEFGENKPTVKNDDLDDWGTSTEEDWD